jgi:hypothetical protein
MAFTGASWIAHRQDAWPDDDGVLNSGAVNLYFQ